MFQVLLRLSSWLHALHVHIQIEIFRPIGNLYLQRESMSAHTKVEHALIYVPRFIYILFLAIDANFRLRNAVVSTTEQDPPLGDGSAYFVEQAPYNAHICTFVSQEDMISCSGFKVYISRMIYSFASDFKLGNSLGKFEGCQGSPDNWSCRRHLLAPWCLATKWHG